MGGTAEAEGRCVNRIHLRVGGGRKRGNRGQEKEEREREKKEPSQSAI